MKKALKKKWLEALRSGKYSQTTGKLNVPGSGMCCIGVLCDIVDPDAWEGAIDLGFKSWHGDPNMPYSKAFEEATGLVVTTYNTGYPQVLKKLSHMNDDGHTFLEIADWIEANV